MLHKFLLTSRISKQEFVCNGTDDSRRSDKKCQTRFFCNLEKYGRTFITSTVSKRVYKSTDLQSTSFNFALSSASLFLSKSASLASCSTDSGWGTSILTASVAILRKCQHENPRGDWEKIYFIITYQITTHVSYYEYILSKYKYLAVVFKLSFVRRHWFYLIFAIFSIQFPIFIRTVKILTSSNVDKI